MPIKYYPDENQEKISSVEFSGDLGMTPSLVGTADWTPNPGLSIITGVNGSGKSQLLYYLHEKLKKQGCENIFHLSSESRSSHDTNHKPNTARNIMNSYRVCKGEVFKYYYNKKDDQGKEHAKDDLSNLFSSVYNPDPYLDDFAERVIKSIDECNITDPGLLEIEDHINKIVIYEGANLNAADPMKFLKNIFTQYRDRLKQIGENIKTELNVALLYDFASKEASITPNDFIEKISHNAGFRTKIIDSYCKSRSPLSPLEEINEVMRKYKFKYRITTNDYYPNDPVSPDSNWNLVFTDPDPDSDRNIKSNISFDQLSSGEQMVIRMMTWLYYNNGLNVGDEKSTRKIPDKIKIMLLDEPDAHLDPKLSKVFMDVVRNVFVQSGTQVIMTTHRIDTVALSREGELFVIEQKKDQQKQIKPCHKIQALAKLSRNLQNYTGTHIKVYTESFNDAKFYEGIYANLMRCSNTIRENKLHDSNLSDPFLKKIARLSRRYQMGFYPASSTDGKDGGYSKVIDMVKIESNYVASKQESLIDPEFYTNSNSYVANLFRGYRVDAPFGIIDKDYVDNTVNLDSETKYRISRLDVHSLENFMYNPILMCSVLKKEDIENNIKDGIFKQNMRKLHDNLNLCTGESFIKFGAMLNIQSALNSIYYLIFQRFMNYKSDFVTELKNRISTKIIDKINALNSSITIDSDTVKKKTECLFSPIIHPNYKDIKGKLDELLIKILDEKSRRIDNVKHMLSALDELNELDTIRQISDKVELLKPENKLNLDIQDEILQLLNNEEYISILKTACETYYFCNNPIKKDDKSTKTILKNLESISTRENQNTKYIHEYNLLNRVKNELYEIINRDDLIDKIENLLLKLSAEKKEYRQLNSYYSAYKNLDAQSSEISSHQKYYKDILLELRNLTCYVTEQENVSNILSSTIKKIIKSEKKGSSEESENNEQSRVCLYETITSICNNQLAINGETRKNRKTIHEDYSITMSLMLKKMAQDHYIYDIAEYKETNPELPDDLYKVYTDIEGQLKNKDINIVGKSVLLISDILDKNKSESMLSATLLYIRHAKSFDRIRGHNLANFMQHYLNPDFDYKSMVLNKIFSTSLGQRESIETEKGVSIAIPCDLIDTIMELNGKIKFQVLEKTDPDKIFKYKDDTQALRDKGYNIDRLTTFVERYENNMSQNEHSIQSL